MRMTDSIRRAFVASVVNAVPEVDYREQMQAIATRAAASSLPKDVLALWMRPEYRDYITTTQERVGDEWLYVPGVDGVKFSQEVHDEVKRLSNLNDEQRQRRRDLTTKLQGAIRSCTTTQRVATLFPEFAKYLPKDDEATANLPAVTGVVEAFKAAGWTA